MPVKKKKKYKALPRKKKKVYAVKRRKSRKVVRKKAARKTVRKKSTPQTVSHLKSRIRKKLDDQLKDALFKRDKATTYKQHRAVQLRIDKIRSELRKIN